MFRPTFVLTVSTLLVANAFGDPIPKSEGKFHYPTATGTKWVFTDGKKEYTEVILMSKDGPNGSREYELGNEEHDEVRSRYCARVSETGLRLTSTDEHGDLDQEFWELKLPVKKKQKWSSRYATKDRFDIRCESVQYPAEKVVVPAGTFMAIKVEHHLERGIVIDQPVTVTTWFAPKVGKIKSCSSDDMRVSVLKSFKLGTEK